MFLVHSIITSNKISYDLGRTRVYFKSGVLEELEGLRLAVLQKYATCIQCCARGSRQRKDFRKRKAGVILIQAFFRQLECRVKYNRIRKDVSIIQAHLSIIHSKSS